MLARTIASMWQGDPERQVTVAFMLIFLGISAVGAIVLWLLYGVR